MDLGKIQELTFGIPIMSQKQGKTIYEFIIKNRLVKILELGFYHGVSTCYLAAAAEELEGGHVTAVDNQIARRISPSAQDLIARAGLNSIVDLHFEERSYTWFLLRLLEKSEPPTFDFCYIDGAHTWDTDGFAFFLVDKLLKPAGWILFDDLNWSMDMSPGLRDANFLRDVLQDPDFLNRTPQEERRTKQVRKIWDLLVTQHEHYGHCIVDGNWGFAQKVKTDVPRKIELHEGLMAGIVRKGRRMVRGLATTYRRGE